MESSETTVIPDHSSPGGPRNAQDCLSQGRGEKCATATQVNLIVGGLLGKKSDSDARPERDL